jgi:hypothetical protein
MSALPPKADIQTGVIDHGSVVLRLIARAPATSCPVTVRLFGILGAIMYFRGPNQIERAVNVL